MIREQQTIDAAFSDALCTVGNGYLAFGAENKYLEALLLVLDEAVEDRYGYISWWLYEGADSYEIWSSDESQKWVLKEPEALYDYLSSILPMEPMP